MSPCTSFQVFINARCSKLLLLMPYFYVVFFKVVELDFLYSSDGTRRWWDNVYRITVVAATWDQTALILSVPKRKSR